MGLRAFLTVLALLQSASFAGAGDANTPAPTDALESFAMANRVGDRDYWLVIQNVMGDNEKVALILGMADDLAFCNSLADAYRAVYPNTRLHCEPAN